MPLLILFLILLLGCATSNGRIEGIRYSVRKAVYIDESYFENVSYSEKCLARPDIFISRKKDMGISKNLQKKFSYFIQNTEKFSIFGT